MLPQVLRGTRHGERHSRPRRSPSETAEDRGGAVLAQGRSPCTGAGGCPLDSAPTRGSGLLPARAPTHMLLDAAGLTAAPALEPGSAVQPGSALDIGPTMAGLCS